MAYLQQKGAMEIVDSNITRENEWEQGRINTYGELHVEMFWVLGSWDGQNRKKSQFQDLILVQFAAR